MNKLVFAAALLLSGCKEIDEARVATNKPDPIPADAPYTAKIDGFGIRCEKRICFIHDKTDMIIGDARFHDDGAGIWVVQIRRNNPAMQLYSFSVPYRTSILYNVSKVVQ